MLAFLSEYGLPPNVPIREKYETPQALAYKAKLKAEVGIRCFLDADEYFWVLLGSKLSR